MRKRLILCAMFITLCVLAACGRAEEPVTTEPTTAPPTTAVPTTKKPEPETVISYDFKLDELPEIGKYQPKTIRYFYDEPLKEFRPSERYGMLIPYRLSYNKGKYSGIGNYGFMTADGEIVTGGIYNELQAWDIGGKTVYRTSGKVFTANPTPLPDRETDNDKYWEAYWATADYCEENIYYQLISSDGSKCLTFRSEPEFVSQTGSNDIKLLIQRENRVAGERDSRTTFIDSYVLYDADFTEVADLSGYLQTYNYAYVMYCGDDILVIEAERVEDPSEVGIHDLLFFYDGVYDHTLEMDGEPVERVYGRLVECEKRLYNENGHTVYRFGETHPDITYDPINDHLYMTDVDRGTICKLDGDGNVTDTAPLPALEEYTRCQGCISDGIFYYIIIHGSYFIPDKYLVYNSDLEKVCEIDGGEEPNLAFCSGFNDPIRGVFLVASDGKTDILDITGAKLATVPFEFEQYDFNYNTLDGDLLYISRVGQRCAIYDFKENTLTVLPHFGQEPAYTLFFSKRLLAYSETTKVGDHESRQYVLRDIATGETRHKNIDDLNICYVNGEIYLSYLKNGTLYVCDEELNVIAALNDSINV